jgi:hypothetical protein
LRGVSIVGILCVGLLWEYPPTTNKHASSRPPQLSSPIMQGAGAAAAWVGGRRTVRAS